MRKSHRASHDHVNRHYLHSANVIHSANAVSTDSCASSLNDMKEHTGLTASRLNNIQNHLTQNGDGTGTSHGVMLDNCASKLTDISSNASLTASRLNNIQNKLSAVADGTGDTAGVILKSVANHLTQNGDGTGTSHGVMLDNCASKLTDISSNSTLTASRLNNIQNKLSAVADGTGDTAGVILKSIEDAVDTIKSYQFTIRGTHANLMSASTSCVAAGTTSSVVDWFALGTVPKRITICVNCETSPSGSFEVYGSLDGTTYTRVNIGNATNVTMGNTNPASATILTQGAVTLDWSVRYIKIIVYSLGSYVASVCGLA